MRNNVILKSEESCFVNSDGIHKATALLYLKEALLKEEYEGCKELADSARKFGAQQGEISKVIAAYLRGNTGGQSEANQKKSRLFI